MRHVLFLIVAALFVAVLTGPALLTLAWLAPRLAERDRVVVSILGPVGEDGRDRLDLDCQGEGAPPLGHRDAKLAEV